MPQTRVSSASRLHPFKLHLNYNLNWDQKVIAVELARLIGFHSEFLNFPITSLEEGLAIPQTWAELAELWPQLAADLPAHKNKSAEQYLSIEDLTDYLPASKTAHPLDFLEHRSQPGLEDFFRAGVFFVDRDKDQLNDQMTFQIALEDEDSLELLSAACNLAARMGLETTSYAGQLLVHNLVPEKPSILLALRPESKILLEAGSAPQLLIQGQGKELAALIQYFCAYFPSLDASFDYRDLLMNIEESLELKHLNGQVAYAKAYGEAGDLFSVDSDLCKLPPTDLAKSCPQIDFQNYKAGKLAYEKSYDFSWEVDEFQEIFKNELLPKLKVGDQVSYQAALSEGPELREKLAGEIMTAVTSQGARVSDSYLICSYKQGYSWIDEVILPQIRQLAQPVEKVEIAFQPFLPAGETSWQDVDGARPSYDNIGGDPNQWYDLPIRYLQELYPIEDRICEVLEIKPQDVIFKSVAECTLTTEEKTLIADGRLTYIVRALDNSGKEIFRNNYYARASERPYLEDFPHMGKVHPASNFLVVYVNGKKLLDHRFASDVEKVWDCYQREILPDLRRYLQTKYAKAPQAEEQPFFDRLEVQIAISEPDYPLASRQDLFSSLDGLHEDIYFAGSDYFKNLGVDLAGEAYDSVGLLLPLIKERIGAPQVRVRLYDRLASAPQCNSQALKAKTPVMARLRSLELRAESLCAHIKVSGANPKLLSAWQELHAQGLSLYATKPEFLQEVVLESPAQSYYFKDLDKIVGSKSLSNPPSEESQAQDIAIPRRKVLGYEDYIELCKEFQKLSAVKLRYLSRSYQNREIYGVEVLPPDYVEACKKSLPNLQSPHNICDALLQPHCYLSRLKRLTFHPSILINARHHANEVSSSNAVFCLLKELVSKSNYQELAQKLNLFVLPCENVDGTALHYKLQAEHPYWKLHVARFNALGKEFAKEKFKSDTLHESAKALSRAYFQYLPDIEIDNHGVPSHEWEQQFSGYTSPSYKGFWLPRSLIYGYFWYVTDAVYQENYKLNKKMEDVIAEAFIADAEIRQHNQDWARQFEKYAHAWMPKLFPANYYKEMINYWIPFPYKEGHGYLAVRFPWLTTVSYTSEVADETAQGEYLELCARAHLCHDLATLEMAANLGRVMETESNISEQGIRQVLRRHRPLQVDLQS